MDPFIPNPIMKKTIKIHPGIALDCGSLFHDIHPVHCWISQQQEFDPDQEQTHNYIFVK